MLEVNYAMRCCGTHEINGLSYQSTPERAMLEFCKVIYPTEAENKTKWEKACAAAAAAGCHSWDPRFTGGMNSGAVYEHTTQYSRFRFAIFTEAVAPNELKDTRPGRTYGRRFAKLIEQEKLGSLVSTEKHELNPNSENLVKVWVWGIDHDALKAWYAKQMGVTSWEQKPMSAVLGGAAAAVNLSGSLQAGCGTTIASAGSVPTLNNGSQISGLSRQR